MARPHNPRDRTGETVRDPHERTDSQLLARITRSAGGKAGYKQLIRELGLGGGRERRLLLEQLTRLVARGELTRTEDEMWAIPRADPSASTAKNSSPGLWNGLEASIRSGRDRLVSGRIDLHRDGFGFVRTETNAGKEREPPRPGGESQDIFIPPNEINGAMQGDLVLVDEAPPGRDLRRSGRVARVLTRRNPTVVGIFHYARAYGRGPTRPVDAMVTGARLDSPTSPAHSPGNYVTPLDERLGSAISIPEGDEILPISADSPHRMLGEPAREQQEHVGKRDPRYPLEGLAVDVEITSFPSPGRSARGRVLEVLGPPDAFGVDVEIVIRKHHLPHTFPAPVLAEAEAYALRPEESLYAEEASRREDFRGLPIVTIDGETARDFDDAVLVRKLSNGNTELQVHIADVSWYVRPGSALDTEARLRGTSVYFPDRAVPMLPHALSSGLCSLLPNQDRLVLSCLMEIDAQGEIVRFRVAEGIIRSARRLTYTTVQHCLNAAGTAPSGPVQNERITPEPAAEDFAERERLGLEQPELPAALDAMLELALRLNRKRVRRGSIDFDLPEPVVEFDPDGNMKAIVRSERGWSHRLIEEFMLSANECIATWLAHLGIASIYRIHEMPDPKRILDFEETAAGFGHSLGLGSLPVRQFTMKTDRRESRQRSARGRESRAAQSHEVPESLPVTPQMYQRLVRRISGTPEERILAYLMLRSLKQARYAEKNEGHFALASPQYTHFTSPIRRYPDLIVHRLVRAMLRRQADPRGGSVLSTDPQPWSTELQRRHGARAAAARQSEASSIDASPPAVDPIAADELGDIAVESSQAERRAADAERELIEWKKMKFMAGRVGDDFSAIILSVTKFGFFVELDELFIEGLVPISSLVGDFYTFRDTDRSICGARTGHCFTIGQRVHVLLDRIDRQQRRLQFALFPGTEPKSNSGANSLRSGKSEAKRAKAKLDQKKPAKPKPGKMTGKAGQRRKKR